MDALYINYHWTESAQDVILTITRQYYDSHFLTDCFIPHVHSMVELLLVCDGRLDVSLNDDSTILEPGDILICSPFDKHSGRLADGTDEAYYYCMIFDLAAFFAHILPPDDADRLHAIISGSARFCSVIRAGEPEAAFIHRQIPYLQWLSNRYGSRCRARFHAAAFSLVCELLEGCYEDGGVARNRNFDFIRDVHAYVSAHYREQMSTASICEALSYSKSYFCRRFRESFGANFSDYLCRWRVERAAELRGQPGLTLTDIAAQCGFPDYAWFSQSFRKYKQTTPRRYFSMVEQ
ncbi:MAG: helix-turn-helix transcriptional regulator [Clostridia bacterium]|nr:helix-turn-helix transcriptional regulator [Clostridia bacterium]